jgi:uncharacterized protein (UPF0332 family)
MLTANRVNLSKARIENAKEALLTADSNLNEGLYKAANNRAYYAAFYAIRALLALDGVDFKEHGQTISRNSSDYEDYYVAMQEKPRGTSPVQGNS